jgi:lipoyl(octanoyl) transferase
VIDELWVTNLGVVEYREAHALQERLRAARQAGAVPDTLLLLEHPPVYTRGRRTGPDDLPMGEDWYRAQGIDVVDADRGGKVTYHGPGQLVGYPIMRTADVVSFVRTMESAIVVALAGEGIEAHARAADGPDYTGVWAGAAKIASIGVHVSHGVTTHGFAVNVHNDLQPFEWVVPCGLDGVRMTSLLCEKGGPRRDHPGAPSEIERLHPAGVADGELLRCFRKRMAFAYAEAHGLRQRLVPAARLHSVLFELASVA